MVDANEKDDAPKSNLSVEKDAAQSNIAASTLLSTPNMNTEKTAVASGITDYMEEEEEEEEEEDEDEEEEEYEEEEDEEEEQEEEEEEKVNDGGRTMIAVKNGLNIDEQHNKGKATVEEENIEENAVKVDAIKGEDKEKTAEPRSGEKVGENPERNGRKPRKRNKKTKAAETASGVVPTDGDKPESSKPGSSSKKNPSKRVESMGMVFMCSSKTKTDCFRYKILGLPAGKKDQVAKIYKGMRLFLFDVDLRLMYGIFKAAGPGGFNLEPKAFKSEFPSQVRFIVLEDCLPLAEEKFREAIKENYYTRNKFEGQLNAEQVKKLCKLFAYTGTGKATPRSKPAIKTRRTRPIETRRTRTDETRRIRPSENRRTRPDTSRDRPKNKRRTRDDEDRRPRSRPRHEKRRYTDYDRPPVLYEHEPPVLYEREPPILYEREPPVFEREPPVPRYLPPPAAASPVRSYGYERALEPHPYVRDRAPDHRTYRVLDVEPRHHDEILSRDRDRVRDPYHVFSREDPYALRPEYHLVSREYNPPPSRVVEPVEYRIGGSEVGSYRDVGREYEYRSHRTHYRY